METNSISSESVGWGRTGTSPKPLAIGRLTATIDDVSPRKQACSLDSTTGPHERLRESPAPCFARFSERNFFNEKLSGHKICLLFRCPCRILIETFLLMDSSLDPGMI